VEQILSQDEIDALLKGISDGEIETEKEPASFDKRVDIKPFSLLSIGKTKKEKLPGLDFIYDRFSKSFSSAFSLFVEKEIEISLTTNKYVEYGELLKTLPLPTNMNVITTENLKGFFIVIFDASLIFAVLEIIFGSPAIESAKVEGREFTKIEFRVVRKVIDLICIEMEKAWTPVYEIRCKYSRSEMNPNYITMISPDEVVHLVEFTIEIGGVKGWLKVLIPYGILDTIKEYLIAAPSREDIDMREKWFTLLKRNMFTIPLELRVILGKKRITLQDFLRFTEKDLIFIDKHVDDPVDIFVHNKKILQGSIGTYKGNMAVRIEKGKESRKEDIHGTVL